MSLIAVGDIHGCARTLDRLLTELAPTPDDQFVFIGDYIDRGPDSKGVIERLIRLRDEHACTFLRGNHEVFMLDYLAQSEPGEVWFLNGGIETLDSYSVGRGPADIPPSHIEFLRETRLFYDTPDFFFVHAGIRPDRTIEENLQAVSEDVFLWDRTFYNARSFAWEKPIVCGHTPQPEPINHPQLINIDTGCVYHAFPGMGRLCAVRLPEREFVLAQFAD